MEDSVDEEPYNFIYAAVYVDWGDDADRRHELALWWYNAARATFAQIVDAVAAGAATETFSGNTKTAHGVAKVTSKIRDWREVVLRADSFAACHWIANSPNLQFTDVRLAVRDVRLADPGHYVFAVRARIGPNVVDATEPALATAQLMRTLAMQADPTYGEVLLNPDLPLEPTTRLDVALRRRPDISARESRSALRGYEWITVCPRPLADRLGGVAGLQQSGIFTHVEPLPGGAAWLQATPSPTSYDASVARRLFSVFRTVLPLGQPQPNPAWDTSLVIMETAR